MNISVLTLFPELYDPFFKASIIGKAREKGLINSNIVNLLDFPAPKERIDSPTFGHGAGMLIKPEIIEKAISNQETKYGSAFKIFFSPQGEKLNQQTLLCLKEKIEEKKHLLLVAPRYEGMDARVEQYYADAVISIGDFVLMGGDIPAMEFIEAFLRLIPGIVGKKESVEKESFSGPFLDYPEYTAPVNWKNMEVPEIIRSGNHMAIKKWREEQSASKTITNHFQWLRQFKLTKEQIELSKKFIPSHYAVLMHSNIYIKGNKIGTTSVTSLDIHDIARSSATYGLKNYFLVTPLIDQQKIVKTLLDFWNEGPGAEYNVHRHEAVGKIKLHDDIDKVIEEIKTLENKEPILIATSAKSSLRTNKNISYYDQSKVWHHNRPVLIIFGTGHGLSDEILERCDYILEPIYGFSEFNHLSVRSAAAVIFDRWLGINPKNFV